MIDFDRETLVKMIDHTELSAHSGEKKIANLCSEARSFGFFAVCVNGAYTRFAKELLEGSEVVVCTVAGFPLGAGTSSAKAYEAADAVRNGAGEVDMVINVGALRDKKLDLVRDDIRAVVEASRPALVKVILETCYLTVPQIINVCEVCVRRHVDFVKTSTGFGSGGATVEAVQAMVQAVSGRAGVKASGGIRTYADAARYLDLGCTRLGASRYRELLP